MKILSLNAGYFLGYDGTKRDYLRHPLRALKGDRIIENRKVEKFSKVVEDEEPDAVVLQEVDQGSVRSCKHSRPEKLVKQLSLDFHAFSATKYSGFFRYLPFSGQMSNAILFSEGKVKNYRVKNGRKSLVQELETENLCILSVHLSRFGREVREQQLEEISKIADDKENVVIAGDFNFHKQGEKERAEKILEMDSTSPGKTFRSENPSKALDMAFSTEDVEINAEVIESSISDHRPITLEIENK